MRSLALLIVVLGLCGAAVSLDLPCEAMACWYCTMDRMREECASECETRCKDDPSMATTTTPATVATTPPTPPPTPATTTRKASRTQAGPPVISHFQRTPNEKFMDCCQADGAITNPCYRLCSFETFTKDNMIQAYMQQDCPRTAIRPMVVCAASGNVNHRACCDSRLQQSYEKVCVDFCNPYNYLPGVDAKYGICLDRLDPIKSCFFDYMQAH